MDESKTSKILETLNLLVKNDKRVKQSPTLSHKITKRIKSTNKVIKYFQDISRHRIRSDAKELIVPTPYQPFSREELYTRIETYQTCTNPHMTSSKLNAMEIAIRGWKYNKDGELYCESCYGRFKMKFTEDDELNNRLEDVYLNKLEKCHNENCPWRRQHTPKSVYEINFINLNNELNEFDELYQKNVKADQVKLRKLITKDEEDLIKRYLKLKGCEVNEVGLQLTLFGWESDESGKFTILKSRSDARRIIVQDNEIDLLEEHHKWCNYVNGYKVLLKIIKTVVICSTVPTSNGEEDAEKEGDDEEGSLRLNTVDETLSRLANLSKLFQ